MHYHESFNDKLKKMNFSDFPIEYPLIILQYKKCF